MRFRFATAAALVALLSLPGVSLATTHNVTVGPGLTFSPATVNITAGDEVIWTRAGGTHSVTADNGSFGNVPSSSWTTFSHTFGAAGTFEYFCEVHSSANGSAMNGTVIVAPGGGGGSPGTLQFSAATTSVGEAAGTKSITVTRTGGDNGAVSVGYETANGSATFGSDYTQTNGTLNWAANDDTNRTIVVPILNDTAEESNETFTVHLQSPTGGATLGSPSTITVTINDNDAPSGGAGTIRWTTASTSVSEAAASVTLTAERTGGSTGAVSVAYATVAGSATPGLDYQTTGDIFSWGNGDSANKTVQVPIVGDTIEESNETFTATLSAPSGGATLGSPATSTVTITDDDVSCEPCVADATTLCLAAGSGDPNRFRVRVTWTDFAGATGPGKSVPFTADSGFFYFFNPNNLELLVKMVRGCGTSLNAYWFFYAAASNVGLEYDVLDTHACVSKHYSNPVGNFASDGDINALATCP
ncbi:MAG: Calx-beta domain-containing protein [Thermoanaerobaculia bacterium]